MRILFCAVLAIMASHGLADWDYPDSETTSLSHEPYVSPIHTVSSCHALDKKTKEKLKYHYSFCQTNARQDEEIQGSKSTNTALKIAGK